jgi:RNA polymerase sigma factor (TIGR02999 family)
MLSSESVTQWLVRWNEGDEAALEQLTPLVYGELRRLAAHYLRQERPDHTMQATALVHEAYLQLIGMQHVRWQGRAQFVGVAAQAMRHILVDHARARAAQKRGGGATRLPLDRAARVQSPRDPDLVELDCVLRDFAASHPRQARVVELLYFGGLSAAEAAKVLGASGEEISQRTVERDWRFARSWLYEKLGHNS